MQVSPWLWCGMSENATVAIVNCMIVIMVISCTIGVAWLTGTAMGLWSMLGLFFFCSTETTVLKNPETDGE